MKPRNNEDVTVFARLDGIFNNFYGFVVVFSQRKKIHLRNQ